MRVLLLADSSASIGTGHAVRSLVLAQAFEQLGVSTLTVGTGVSASQESIGSFQSLNSRECAEPFTTSERSSLIKEVVPDLVVIDGYHFEPELFRFLDSEEILYGVIDDNGETKASNPLFVINSSPHASKELYRQKFPSAVLFLGLEHALIRKEFSAAYLERLPRGNDIMVAFGGSDIKALSVPVSRALTELGFQVNLFLGNHVANRDSMMAELAQLTGVRFPGQADFEKTLASSACAILGAGSSLWEAIALDTPVVGVVVAANQVAPANAAREIYDRVAIVLDGQEPMVPEIVLNAQQVLGVKKSAPRSSSPLDGANRVARSVIGLMANQPDKI